MSSASFAPFISFSISIPATAIGNNPTGVSTENLPPTLSGITNVSYPSSSDKAFSAPLSLSVVTYILLLASSIPYLFSSISLNILNAIAGSVVVPDFDITFIEYLYTMLKMYVEYVGKDIDLNYHTFEYQNKKYTQLEAINYICDVLEEALVVRTRKENILENVSIRTPIQERPKLPEIDYDKVGNAIALFGKILPAMWW